MIVSICGCGKMAKALFSDTADFFKEDRVYTYTPSMTRAKELAKELGGQSVENLEELPTSDILFIACKPQQFDELSNQLKNLNKDSLVVSLMAGVSVAEIKGKLNIQKVVRIMPNTPSQVKEGVTLLYSNENGDTVQKVESLLERVGMVYRVSSEDELDYLTGFCGSGPAYVFEVVRIFTEKMGEKNIESKIGKQLMAQTFLGAAKLLLESDASPLELRDNVTSKKGVTFEALKIFQKRDLQGIINEAMDKAYERAKEISKESN